MASDAVMEVAAGEVCEPGGLRQTMNNSHCPSEICAWKVQGGQASVVTAVAAARVR